MIGTNKIVLNQTTMREAVRFWLSSKWKDPVPDITDVSCSAVTGNFDIVLVTPKDEAEK